MNLGIAMNPSSVPNARSSFQSWAQEQMARLSINPGDVHRALVLKGHNVTEGYVYRLIQGRTAPGNPGYNLIMGIGKVLGDPVSALRLAGFTLPEREIKVQDEKLEEWIKMFPEDEDGRDRIMNLVKSIVDMGREAGLSRG
jgi:hypothetical protein